MPWVDILADITDEQRKSLVDADGKAFSTVLGSFFVDQELPRLDQAGTEQRLLDQYRNSAHLKTLLNILVDEPYLELRSTIKELRKRLNIDAMSGVQLDGIGQIIGRPRPNVLDFAEEGVAFETTDAAGAPGVSTKAFSSLRAPDQGGAFAGLTTNQPMGDADYRVLLKATIFANTTVATIEDLERYGTFVLGTPVRVTNGHTVIGIQIVGRLSPVLRGVIFNTLTAAAGISIDNYTFGVSADAFGFAAVGTPSATNTGFGQVGATQTGSGFGRLLQTS